MVGVLPVYKTCVKQLLTWEQFLFTEVAIENTEEYEEAPDHDNDHNLLMRVQFISDLTSLWFEWSELCASHDPFCQIAYFLRKVNWQYNSLHQTSKKLLLVHEFH